MSTGLDATKSRWRRWVGQKFSLKCYGGVELIDPNYSRWPYAVLGRAAADGEEGDTYWRAAINAATADQIWSLDCIVLENSTRRKTRR